MFLKDSFATVVDAVTPAAHAGTVDAVPVVLALLLALLVVATAPADPPAPDMVEPRFCYTLVELHSLE